MTLIHDHKPPTARSSVLSILLHAFTVPHSEMAISSLSGDTEEAKAGNPTLLTCSPFLFRRPLITSSGHVNERHALEFLLKISLYPTTPTAFP